MRIWFGICVAALLVMSAADASAFSMSFRWCGLGSPVFSLSDVPKGTATLQFHMVDLHVPGYNHGGGAVPLKGQSTVPCGALTDYSPPSPPSGSHSYQITVTALGRRSSNLGSASFTREYPREVVTGAPKMKFISGRPFADPEVAACDAVSASSH